MDSFLKNPEIVQNNCVHTAINVNFKWNVNCVTVNPVILLTIFMLRLAFCIHSEPTCTFVIIYFVLLNFARRYRDSKCQQVSSEKKSGIKNSMSVISSCNVNSLSNNFMIWIYPSVEVNWFALGTYINISYLSTCT